ncbi:hypothetical protein BC332_33708 [Capsicum chinense]|nr:hypothetical protein BC332_33708 [Capsicum chinense]
MNARGKMHPTFINNDRHVLLYMLDVAADGSWPLLRINIVLRYLTIPSPQPTIDEHDSFEDESLDAHPMNSEDDLMELEDSIFCEEEGEEYELRAQTNHTFSDGTNFQVNQTFSSKKNLKLLLDVAAVRNSFEYATLKSCSKFLKIGTSIANGIAKEYNHAHHGYCKSHLDENLRVNHHCGEHLYLFYNATKAYSFEEFSDYFVEFKNYCPEAAFSLKHKLDFEKWSSMMITNIVESVNAMLIDEREYPVESIFNSIAKRFGEIFRERRAYILKCKDNKFVPAAEKILRDNMSEGDSFYMENISREERQYTVFRSGYAAKVDLLKRSCSCRKFDLVKIPCDNAMTALRLKHDEDYGLRVYDYSSPCIKWKSTSLRIQN